MVLVAVGLKKPKKNSKLVEIDFPGNSVNRIQKIEIF